MQSEIVKKKKKETTVNLPLASTEVEEEKTANYKGIERRREDSGWKNNEIRPSSPTCVEVMTNATAIIKKTPQTNFSSFRSRIPLFFLSVITGYMYVCVFMCWCSDLLCAYFCEYRKEERENLLSLRERKRDLTRHVPRRTCCMHLLLDISPSYRTTYAL